MTALMPLHPRPRARARAPLATLSLAVAATIATACTDVAQQADAASPPAATVAATGRAKVIAPADTVDSLLAARRATVMDTTTISRVVRADTSAAKAATDASATAASTATATTASPNATTRPASPDTARRKPARALLGPRSGDRHPAFGDVGSDLDSLWPVKGPEPLPGSILPAQRIIAFYGNPKSTRMGILGQFKPDTMLAMLDAEVAAWTRIDPAHPAKPALHVIVLVADATPGPSGKYRTRHDSAMIEKVYGWARSRDALMFVDLQIGQSTLEKELPWIEKFLIRPDVHLGIDPEFAMQNGAIPGKRVGTYDANDINYATHFLARLVDEHKLPPKILVVHRFTPGGVTHADKIELDPRVQIVMDMDGFGPPWMKRDTYWRDIKKEPVQFTGWKQFTKLKNDKPPTPRGDILRLWPAPLYIQLQ